MKSLAELKQENKNLHSLLDTNRLINSPMSLSKLLSVIMTVAKKVVKAEAATLMLLDENTNELVYEVALGEKGAKIKKLFRLKLGQGVAGWVAKHGKPALIEDATKDPRFYSKVDKKSGFQTKSMVCVPLKVENDVIGILQALNPTHKKYFDEKDLKLFQDFASQAAVAVAKARWHEKEMQQQRLKQDLGVAREIQRNLLSKDLISLANLNFYAKYKPANTVGGDFYDCVVVDSGKAVVILGDVSGKGVSAALYMVKTLTEFRNHVVRYYPNISQIVCSLNRVLSQNATFGMFVTAVVLAFDTEKGELLWCNAGHLPPYLIRGGKRSVTPLEGSTQPPLGILNGTDYQANKTVINEGSQILLYSDGLTEARNKRGAEFGFNRLKKAFQAGVQKNKSKQVIPYLFEQVHAFSHGKERDDQTAVLIGIS